MQTLATSLELYCYGTSEGVQKAWDTRGRGRKTSAKKPEDMETFYHGTVLPSAKEMLKEGLSPQPDKQFQVGRIPTTKGYVYVTPKENTAKVFAAFRAVYDETQPGQRFGIDTPYGPYTGLKRPDAQPAIHDPNDKPAVVKLSIPKDVAAKFVSDPQFDSRNPNTPTALMAQGVIPKEYIKSVSVLQDDHKTWKKMMPSALAAAVEKGRTIYLVYYGPLDALKRHLTSGGESEAE
jgi:hypothetical protein